MWELKNAMLTPMFLVRAIGWMNTSSGLSTLELEVDIQVKMPTTLFDKSSVKY